MIINIRNEMAENGKEFTVGQMKEIMGFVGESFDLSYEKFIWYKSLSDDEIRRRAEEIGDTFDNSKHMIDMILYVGKLKYEHID